MSVFRIAIILVILSLFAEARAQTQSHQSSDYFWCTFGIGAVGPGNGYLMHLASAWGNQSISAKIEYGTTLDWFRGGGRDHDITEYSVYYGRQNADKWAIERIAGGPAYFEANSSSGFIRRFGIGLEAEVLLKIYFYGLGLMTNLMIAPNILYAGLTLNFSFGIWD